ncbi:MAG: reverse transcriptase family protein [Sedimenticola sp.]
MKIGTLNVCGLKSRILYPEFIDLVNLYDILCVTETKLDAFDIISIPNYTLFTKHRKQNYFRKSGGIGIFVKDNISPFIQEIISDSEYVHWLSVNKDFTSLEENIIIGTVYIPPSNSRFFNDDDFMNLEMEMVSMCSTYKYVFVTGDTNGRTGEIADYTPADNFLSDLFDYDMDSISFFNADNCLTELGISKDRKSLDKRKNQIGYRLLDICRGNNLFILNGRIGKDRNIGKLTFRNQSLIDYTLVSCHSMKLVSDFDVIDTDSLFSDGHCLLHMEIKINPEPPTTDTDVTGACTNNRFYWKADKADTFLHNISQTDITNLQETINVMNVNPTKQTINDATSTIADIFNNSASCTFGTSKDKSSTTTNSQDKPWFGARCRNARLLYHQARKRYQTGRMESDKHDMMHNSKVYKMTMNKHIKIHKRKTEKKLRHMQTNQPKEYWKILNKLKKGGVNKGATLDDLYEYFKGVNSEKHDNCGNDDDDDDDIPNLNINDDDEILNVPITADEISKAIRNLNNSKTPGNDLILNEYLKNTTDIMMPHYVTLFNVVLSTGILPDSWVLGQIMPIYKNKGDSTKPENYRPITILSCLGKLFTCILNNRLNCFLDSNSILSENQAGFRKGYSTMDHVFVLHTLIELLRHQKKKVYCAFIDFSQAFDSVWRIGLWKKLLKNNINGIFFRVINNMYLEIKSCVMLNNECSQYFPSYCGVRQGENLSPVLFALFLNDLEDYLTLKMNDGIEIVHRGEDLFFYIRIVCLLYADDTVIIADDPNAFQKCLNDFHDYCNKWKLRVNLSKSKVIVFGSKTNRANQFKLGQTSLDFVNEYKYLGVYFSRSGSFLKARKHVVEQANKATHLLYSRINNIDIPIDLQLKLFDHTILPILTYGSEVWGFENLEIIERIHLNFLRRITKSRKSTPAYMLYAELGRYPLEITIKSRMIAFWNRIVTGKDVKLSNLLFEHALSTDNFEFKWLKQVKSIFDNTGKSNNFVNRKTSVKSIKRTLIDQFIQQWNAALLNSSKGKNYSLFKENTKFENYFKILPRSLYLKLVKFRTSNHKLPVETGRWSNIEYGDRKCNICNTNDIGDEFHYLFICSSLSEERKKYLDTYYYLRPNVLKYKELLNSTSETKLKRLSIFTGEIMNMFND